MPIVEPSASQARVRRQYEALPYPFRNPEDERRRLLLTGLDDLVLVNHYCFGGRKNLTRDLRILVAGGGTGDALVFLAHQLRHVPAEIVYLDLSDASLKIAQQRIRCRNLQDKVTWIQGSLTDVDQYGIGKFDYINCSGVLHHLPDPAAGLRSLRAVLHDDGALGIMVYGQYGRTGVYQLQSLFRLINGDTDDETLKLARARSVLQTLPPSNWYRRGQDLFQSLAEMNDHEMYDLFLHSQDRAYTVPQLHELLQAARLELVDYSAEMRIWYDPYFAFRDPDVLQRVLQLPPAEQQAACEVVWGNLHKHVFWAAPHGHRRAASNDPEMVPQFTEAATYQQVAQSYLQTQGESWQMEFVRGAARVQLSLQSDPRTRRFFELVDGVRTLGDIAETIRREQNLTPENVWQELVEIQRLLGAHDLLALRHRSVPALPRS